MNSPSIDLDRLLRLRLVVARFGEMDLAKWWNTKGQLGRLGAAGGLEIGCCDGPTAPVLPDEAFDRGSIYDE